MTPIERAARAVTECAVIDDITCMLTNPEAIARAVLLAIREPSEAMCEAAWGLDKLGPDVIDVPYQGVPEDMWPAMIDAVLKEGK